MKRGSMNTEPVVIMTCCILMGLVLLWWKSGRVAETIDSGTQTLEEVRRSQDVPTKIMVRKHGKAAHCRNDCPFLLKSHVIQLVFSLRSKRRLRQARLEAAHWVMRTSFLNLRVFCISSQSHRFLFTSCTLNVLVALTLLMTHHFNATRANVSCARLRQASALISFWYDVFPFPLLEPLLVASHPCFDSDSSRGVTVRNTSPCVHLQHATLT